MIVEDALAGALGVEQEFATAAPPVSAGEAADFARAQFGLSATARALTGERDANFHLTGGGAEYLLKIAHPAEDARAMALQTGALLHVAATAPGLPIPRMVTGRDGRHDTIFRRPGETPRLARMMTYLPGILLHQVPLNDAVRANLGKALAGLGLALKDYAHPGARGRPLLWDLQHAAQLRELLPHVEDRDLRGLAGAVLDRFEGRAAPVLPGLRAQLIHNDLNPHNVLVDPDEPSRVAGIIDFGDLVHAPLVCDVAVAATYLLGEADPLAGVEVFAGAYHRLVPLRPAELGILFDLVATRLAMTVLITAWRASLFPKNRGYILRNQPRARRGLESFADIPADRAAERLRTIGSGAGAP